MQLVVKTGAVVAEAKPWVLLGRPGPSLFEALFPSAVLVHKLAASLALTGVLVGLARARFYLPDNPVPITFQTFGVLIIGGVLGWRWGLFSILLYYFMGMAGLQVFQGGAPKCDDLAMLQCGWEYASNSPTGGYLIGFIAASWMVGYLSQRGWNRGRVLWPMLLGSMVIYVPGLLWLHFNDFGWPAEGELFKGGMYPFIPGDLVKLALAAIATGFGWKVAERRGTGADPE